MQACVEKTLFGDFIIEFEFLKMCHKTGGLKKDFKYLMKILKRLKRVEKMMQENQHDLQVLTVAKFTFKNGTLLPLLPFRVFLKTFFIAY